MSAGSLNPSGEHPTGDHTAELRQILEALFEERADAAQLSRLDELVIGDSACRRFYLEYVDLHGNLYWDAAQAKTTEGNTTQGDIEPVPIATPLPERRADTRPASLGVLVDSLPRTDRLPVAVRRVQPGWIWAALAVAATGIVVGLANWPTQPAPGPVPNVGPNLAITGNGPQPQANPPAPADESLPKAVEAQPLPNREKSTQPSVAAVPPANSQSAEESLPERKSPPASLPVAASVKPAGDHPPDGTARAESAIEPEPKDVVAFIDATEEGVEDNRRQTLSHRHRRRMARRVYLDIAGHIPPEAAVDAFLRDESSGKRSRVVSQLLKEPDYARNWATIWANLLVGRQPRAAGVSREMLEKFCATAFPQTFPGTRWSTSSSPRKALPSRTRRPTFCSRISITTRSPRPR